MLKPDFNNYSIKDFLLDESFQQWVNKPDGLNAWGKWLKANPEKSKIVEEVRLEILLLRIYFQEEFYQDDLDDVWRRIQNSLDKKSVTLD